MKIKAIIPTVCAFIQSVLVTTAYASADGHTILEEENGSLVLKPGTFPSLRGSLAETTQEANKAVDRAITVGNFIFAVLLLVLMALLIINIVKLAGAGDDERARKEGITKLMFTLIAIALMGSIGIIVSLSQNLF